MAFIKKIRQESRWPRDQASWTRTATASSRPMKFLRKCRTDVWRSSPDGTVGDGVIDMHDYGPVPTEDNAGRRAYLQTIGPDRRLATWDHGRP